MTLMAKRFFDMVGGDDSRLPMDVRLRISLQGVDQGEQQVGVRRLTLGPLLLEGEARV